MAKVNVSIPDALLEDVDDLASKLGKSRSGFVQEATARYVTQVEGELAREARRRSIDRAVEQAREIGRHVGPFDSTAAIRADRDRDGRRAGKA